MKAKSGRVGLLYFFQIEHLWTMIVSLDLSACACAAKVNAFGREPGYYMFRMYGQHSSLKLPMEALRAIPPYPTSRLTNLAADHMCQ